MERQKNHSAKGTVLLIIQASSQASNLASSLASSQPRSLVNSLVNSRASSQASSLAHLQLQQLTLMSSQPSRQKMNLSTPLLFQIALSL